VPFQLIPILNLNEVHHLMMGPEAEEGWGGAIAVSVRAGYDMPWPRGRSFFVMMKPNRFQADYLESTFVCSLYVSQRRNNGVVVFGGNNIIFWLRTAAALPESPRSLALFNNICFWLISPLIFISFVSSFFSPFCPHGSWLDFFVHHITWLFVLFGCDRHADVVDEE